MNLIVRPRSTNYARAAPCDADLSVTLRNRLAIMATKEAIGNDVEGAKLREISGNNFFF